MVTDFVRLGFTAEIPLPNQGFPAPFLEGRFPKVCTSRKLRNSGFDLKVAKTVDANGRFRNPENDAKSTAVSP